MKKPFTKHRWVRLLIRVAAWYVAGILLLGLLYRILPPVSTLMLADVITLNGYTRERVSLGEVSTNMLRAVIRAEDGRFCEHHGVDWQSMNQAIEDAVEEDGPSRGASTISMQVAKNLFLWPHRSYARKILEVPIAMYLDFIWPKTRMMEVYLSMAEWGKNLYGIEAASQHYFGKSAKSLSSWEAASLAAALPNPLKRNPSRASAYHASYAKRIVGGIGNADISCLR
jgi:monofunctional biosynthetic peptidoglycan transglycosylase